jgi:hypothetical protein
MAGQEQGQQNLQSRLNAAGPAGWKKGGVINKSMFSASTKTKTKTKDAPVKPRGVGLAQRGWTKGGMI